MYNESSINKRSLWRYVNKKIKRIIHHYHVLSIITILFDEILKDLISGKDIKIFNFGNLSLKKMKPRKYHDINQKRTLLSKEHRILRFTLSPIIRKKLCKNIDINKTFREE
jgi:nucleoid DNA-binding protein